MNIVVNGSPTETTAVTVGELADEMSVRRPGIAIAVNGRVVRSTAWNDTPLYDGNAVEIVTAAAGG